MKAVQVRAPGGREALELCELPDPVPGKDEVLVRVRISGVNLSMPTIAKGNTSAVTIHSRTGGSGLCGSARGKRVRVLYWDAVVWFGMLGGYAEKAVVPAERLLKVLPGMALDISQPDLAGSGHQRTACHLPSYCRAQEKSGRL